MYKTGGWKELIEVVEITKVTEKSVWIEGLRTAISKRSNYGSYWDTMEEAKEHLKEKYNSRIESLEIKLKRAKYDLDSLNNY